MGMADQKISIKTPEPKFEAKMENKISPSPVHTPQPLHMHLEVSWSCTQKHTCSLIGIVISELAIFLIYQYFPHVVSSYLSTYLIVHQKNWISRYISIYHNICCDISIHCDIRFFHVYRKISIWLPFRIVSMRDTYHQPWSLVLVM